MSKRKIYIVSGIGRNYANWMEGEIVNQMEDANLILFTGGEDVSPELYGKAAHPTTCYSIARDAHELKEFRKAMTLGLPKIGICRGSQLACALSGGKLVQDQKHEYYHPIKTKDGREFITTSTHHQRAYIKDMNAADVELIAWAEHLSPYSFGENNQDIMDEEKECEIVYYNRTNFLGIQGHPEYMYPAHTEWENDFIEYCQQLITDYLKI